MNKTQIILETYLNNLQDFDFEFEIRKGIEYFEADIVLLNSDKQLFDKGVTNENVSISSFEPYAAFTVRLKEIRGQPTDRVTLRDTEAFHKSFLIKYGAKEFEITATDLKTEKLKRKYTRQIFGLTDENFEFVKNNFILPYVMNEVQKLNET